MIAPVATDALLDVASRAPAPPDLVSVVVSLFNYARYLPDCLGSVAAQVHRALELIVVDDASSEDDSAVVARDWLAANAARFTRVTLLRHRRNQGLAQARNTAFAAAASEHVFVLDADNMLYPRAIARLAEIMARERCAAVYSQLEFFGVEQRLGHADLWDAELFKHGNYVDAMALVSKQAWRDVGGYTHLDGGWEDFDFWCKCVTLGLTGVFVPEILCRYRVHRQSMLHTEHQRLSAQLAVQITRRHPWLQLDDPGVAPPG